MRIHLFRSIVLASLAVAAPCQPPLTLSGDAGSLPGPFNLELTGASIGNVGGIFLAGTSGPTPLSAVNPGDPRQLAVGFAPQPFVIVGAFLPPNGTLTAPTFNAPNNPALLGRPIYMQGVAAGFTQIIGSISQPQPAWFGAASSFVDRNTQFVNLGGRCTTALVERADQRTMLTGGASGALWAQVATDTTEIYDPVTDSFVPGPTMSAPRSVHTATQLLDGRYLIVGGVDQANNPINTSDIYDPVADTFTAGPNMALPRFLHTAHLMPDGRVLVVGGMTFNSITMLPQMIASAQTTTEIYDPTTNTFSPGPAMATPRAGHATASLSNGRVLVTGGVGFFTVLGQPVPTLNTSAEVFDPSSMMFGSPSNMASPRGVPVVAELGNDRVLVAGGHSVLNLLAVPPVIGTATNTAEIYDGATNSWSPAGNMAQARGLASAIDLGGGRFLLAGGSQGDIPTPIAIDGTEIYDTATNAFTPGPKMAVARAAYAVRINHLGQAHILGGANGATATCLDTTEWYYR